MLKKKKKQRESSSRYYSRNFLPSSGNLSKLTKAAGDVPKAVKYKLLSIFDEKGLIRTKGRIDRSQLKVNSKHPILFFWKHHSIELILQDEHKKKQFESTENVGNEIIQQKL